MRAVTALVADIARSSEAEQQCNGLQMHGNGGLAGTPMTNPAPTLPTALGNRHRQQLAVATLTTLCIGEGPLGSESDDVEHCPLLALPGSYGEPLASHAATMQLAAMIYRPGQTTARAPGGCWTCSQFIGEVVAGGAHVRCRQVPTQPRVIASPSTGCAFWMREPGTD